MSRGDPDNAGRERVSDSFIVEPGENTQLLHVWQQPMKPWELWLRQLAPPGSLICDPFSGSGTTAAAVKRIGRRMFVGTEIDEGNYKVAMSRLNNEEEAETPPVRSPRSRSTTRRQPKQ